jgi:hypothetical protein
MTRCGAIAGALLINLALPVLRAAVDNSNFTGHYELADKNADQSFSLDVTQTGSHAEITFLAAMADGSGAAPDGDGFDNEGTGTLVAEKDGYHLKLTATQVTEPRALRFYGDVLLRKTSNKVQPDAL